MSQKSQLHDGERDVFMTLLRVVHCDDGVVRYEPVADDMKVRLHEDDSRNIFVTGYLGKGALRHAGIKVQR